MNVMMMIVDPQIDFVDGALPVPGAPEAMERLAGFIAASDGDYCCKVVTADCHPYSHCSFADCGGEWPRHCVADTIGAAIYNPLVEPLFDTSGDVYVLHKGTDAKTEEYSVFRNLTGCKAVKDIVERYTIDRIDICGLAGDVCVLNTLSDGVELFGAGMFRVLTEFSPSLDCGRALDEYISLNNISCDR